ncbi:MAG TPA: XRE family transcriptional regulator [Acidimicrobiia bacterium]|jgi:DNA-binding XRE family transcriptional regulator|nr:XRE family transcriptional regulator [Acidimicrobiia bacterium]
MATRNFKELSDPIMKNPKRRASIERHRRESLAELVAYQLAELRKLRELTQHEVAQALGVTQPNVSFVENGTDVMLSTLRNYIEALGGILEVNAVFDGERIPLDLLDKAS